MISGNTEIAWRARSPDEAPSDYFLWGICDQDIRRVKPRYLGELQEVVSDFVEFPDKEVVRKAIRDVRPRSEMCIKMGGGNFETQLKGNDSEVKISRPPGLMDT